MKVHMDCSGCENKIRKALHKMDGVDSVEIDMDMQKVTVTGTFSDQMKVLKQVRKTSRRAELWPFPYNPEYDSYASEYYNEEYYQGLSSATDESSQAPAVSSYKYYKHGYEGHSRGLYHQLDHLSGLSDPSTSMFSDENLNACSIM